jgi:hypothetical protein
MPHTEHRVPGFRSLHAATPSARLQQVGPGTPAKSRSVAGSQQLGAIRSDRESGAER